MLIDTICSVVLVALLVGGLGLLIIMGVRVLIEDWRNRDERRNTGEGD